MENYIMFEGTKIPLTDEQIEMLKGAEKTEDVKKNPFERAYDRGYYFIQYDGTVEYDFDRDAMGDDYCLAVANYCTDKKMMEQRALHETLNRLLWRFSMENGEEENKWDCKNDHYEMYWSCSSESFEVCRSSHAKSLHSVYFPTKKLAQCAIDEIIKPFIEEHPDFVW